MERHIWLEEVKLQILCFQLMEIGHHGVHGEFAVYLVAEAQEAEKDRVQIHSHLVVDNRVQDQTSS